MDGKAEQVCKRLRNRAFYLAEPDEAGQFEFSPESACWCAHTLIVLGPDQILCSPGSCQPGRECFEPR